jgi:hypothetical protein
MPASISVIDKVLQFTKTRQTKKAQSQAQVQQQSKHLNSPIEKNNGFILLPVLAQPNGGPGRFREEFEPLLLKEKEESIDLFPIMLEVSPQGKESKAPRKANSFNSQFSPLPSKHERRRQRLEAGLEIRFFSCESSNSTMETLVPDCQKPLPALPPPELLTPDYDKPLPPIPEIEEEFTFFFDTICRNCGEEEGNTQKGWSGQDFEMWVDTEDCGYCRDGDDGEVGAAGLDIRDADIMWLPLGY